MIVSLKIFYSNYYANYAIAAKNIFTADKVYGIFRVRQKANVSLRSNDAN